MVEKMKLRQETDASALQAVPEVLIQPANHPLQQVFSDLWCYRELLLFLAWRDIKVRYKQTVLGAAWALLQPLLTMAIFSVIFGLLARLPSDGIPYPIFTFTALLPWQLFSYALNMSSTSLVADQNLISKVYFPRLVIPLSSVLAGILDFAIAFGVLLGMMLVFRWPVTWRLAFVPIFVLLALATAMAVGLWLSALNVQYRDIRYTLPFLTQFWMYATPIAYSSTLIPEKWMAVYSLNPMVGVVEGFRWVLLGKPDFAGLQILVSFLITLVLLIGGIYYFYRMENTFADVI
jgi:lipopolysaccharide transport system permease protein